MSELSRRILQRRLELGLSQEELAQRMGYRSKSSITKLEKGVNDIPQSKVEEFAAALETTPAWLMGLEKCPIVEIHPSDAEKLGMSDKEPVILRTPVGSMELELSIDSSCLPGSVNVYHGAGSQDINLLIDDTYLDPVSGFPGYKSYCCRLEKKEETHE